MGGYWAAVLRSLLNWLRGAVLGLVDSSPLVSCDAAAAAKRRLFNSLSDI